MPFEQLSNVRPGESISWHQLYLLMVILALPAIYYLTTLTTSPRSSTSNSSKTPPGSLGLPILGENADFFRAFNKPLGIYEFFLTRFKKHGNIFKTNFLGSIRVVVTGKEAAKFIFSNENNLVNLTVPPSMRDLIGHHSIFQARGEHHKKMKRVMGEPLSMDSLKRYLNGIEDAALNVLNKWKDKEELRVLDETTDYTFKIISYILFSSKPGREHDRLKQCFEKVSEALVSLPFNVPGFSYHEGMKARRIICQMVDEIIKKRREGICYENDFLQSVLTRDHEKISDSELKDSLIAILFAGHETSAAGIMWAVKFIGDNPSVEDTLIVINETLRMANIGRLLPRTSLQDFEIYGYLVKKDWRIALDTQQLHLDAAIFFEPYEFNPSWFDVLVMLVLHRKLVESSMEGSRSKAGA